MYRRLIFCLLAAALAGCKAGSPRLEPLPARSVPTAGGQRLELAGRTVTLRPAPGAIEQALGARLTESNGAVSVVRTLRKSARLRAGDRILLVAARLPGEGLDKKNKDKDNKKNKEDRAAEKPGEKAAPREVAPARPRTPDQLRRRPGVHPVRAIADLRPYMAGVGWVRLDLLVQRGAEQTIVSERLRVPRVAIEYQEAQPKIAEKLGYTACALAGWPADQRPAHAKEHPDALMVVRVEADSPAALAGLRPGDLLLEQRPDDALERIDLVRLSSDGKRSELRLVATDSGFWAPLLASYSNDGRRSHLGIGPFDWLFHHSTSLAYDAATDTHRLTTRWSVLTIVQRQSSWRRGVRKNYTAVDPIVDIPRLEYFIEWLTD